MPNHRNVYISVATSMSKTGKFQLTPLIHRSANNGFVFVVGKRKIISGVIFDVESESETRISLSRQDFEIFESCARRMGFIATFEVIYRAPDIFLVFFSNVTI